MKYAQWAYWLVTILMCVLFIYSAQMYFFKTDMVRGFFESLNFPTWVVIPLAIAKIAGVIAVLTNFNKLLTEWAYAGFFYDVILAKYAHFDAGHPFFDYSFYGIFLVIGSRMLLRYRSIKSIKS